MVGQFHRAAEIATLSVVGGNILQAGLSLLSLPKPPTNHRESNLPSRETYPKPQEPLL